MLSARITPSRWRRNSNGPIKVNLIQAISTRTSVAVRTEKGPSESQIRSSSGMANSDMEKLDTCTENWTDSYNATRDRINENTLKVCKNI